MSTTPSASETASAAESRARARIDATIDGKWHLDSLLGVGGMAAVYASTHRNGTRAAVKILHPEIALNTALKTRFLREGYVANKIGHPNVVRVLDDDEAPDGTVYLVMELLDGESLQDIVIRQRKLDEVEVLRIAHEVLDVLEAAHAKEIIHRDLKPGNLLRLGDGTVKLLDFGVAKVRQSAADAPNATTLAALGTPGFMPPEQARGRWDSVDARADIWALGATMFALSTGRFVHEEETTNEQLLAAMTKPAPALREVLPDASEGLAELVDRALAFDREKRFQSAAEMKRAIAERMRAAGASVPPTKIVPDSARVVIDPRARASDAGPTTGPVDHEAPTLNAPTTDGAAVSDVQRRRSEPPGGPKLRPMHYGVAALVVSLIGTAAWFSRSSPNVTADGAATASAPTAPGTPSVTAPAPSFEAPSASPSPSSPAASTSASAPASAASVVKRVVPPPAHTAGAATASASVTAVTAPASTPAPSGTVDIFGKRR